MSLCHMCSESEEVGHDYITTVHVAIKNTELAQNWLRVSSCTQHYSLVGHRLPNLNSLMVVGKIDLRVNYTLGTFAAMSGMKENFDTRDMYLNRGPSWGLAP